jgi:hypothetical protein
MPKIVTITTKFEDREWLLVNKNLMTQPADSDVLTPEDVRDYLEPVRQAHLALPGIIPEKQQIVFRGNISVLFTEFDTFENAQSAFNLIHGRNPPEVYVALRNLIESDKYKFSNVVKSIQRSVQSY